jgi:hypothetical protein
MKSKTIAGMLICVVLSGCARTSVLPLSSDTFQITSSAAIACGAQGAQKIALRRAAKETLRNGFDKFVIMGAQAQNNTGVVGYTPMTANTYGSATATTYGNMTSVSGSATTNYYGGQPIYGGSFDQGLVVKAFRADDPQGANAISARKVLGAEWQKEMNENENTCL